MNTQKLILVAALTALAMMTSACGPTTFGEAKVITGSGLSANDQGSVVEGVKYLDLVSSNNSTNVFRARCASCHNDSLKSGGLNLLDEDAAKLASPKILKRIRAASNQMPPTGPLPELQKRQIESWVNEGLN